MDRRTVHGPLRPTAREEIPVAPEQRASLVSGSLESDFNPAWGVWTLG